ncbi:MAG: actA [Ignavibacteria bacterium]|nr:actA [Ignavibacteria bacterium]
MNKKLLDYTLKIRLPITVFVIIIAMSITYYVSRNERDGIGNTPTQPILFSHKLHAGDMKIDCQYCHTGVTKGRHALIPSVGTCMNCHSVARKDKPEIQKLTKIFLSGEALQWQRVHRTADYVYFNHSSHVSKNIDCKYCHGDVAAMEKISQVHSFTMGSCVDCHRTAHKSFPEIAGLKKGPDHCWACHR